MLTDFKSSDFYGTQGYYYFNMLFRNFVLTDGTNYIAKNGGQDGAYWLFEAIASHWPTVKKSSMAREFQLWELTVNADKSAVLTCKEDSDRQPLITQKIEYTDFDLPYIKFFVEPTASDDGKPVYVIMLPSER